MMTKKKLTEILKREGISLKDSRISLFVRKSGTGGILISPDEKIIGVDIDYTESDEIKDFLFESD